MKSLYRDIIMKSAKVDEREAVLVESVMRDEFGTLDHLTASRLGTAARRAKKVLDYDPELRKLVEEQNP